MCDERTIGVYLCLYFKSVRSLKFIKELVASPRQSYYCDCKIALHGCKIVHPTKFRVNSNGKFMGLFLPDPAKIFYIMDKWGCWQI